MRSVLSGASFLAGPGRQQDCLDLLVAGSARVLERRHTFSVRQVGISSGLDQQIDDLLVPRTAIAENDRLQERRPTQIVDVIDIDTGCDERAHRLDMTTLRGGDQGGAAVAVGTFEVGAMSKRHLEDFETPARPGIKIRAIIDPILGVDVGAGINQRLGGFDPVAMGRNQQRGRTAAVARVDLHATGALRVTADSATTSGQLRLTAFNDIILSATLTNTVPGSFTQLESTAGDIASDGGVILMHSFDGTPGEETMHREQHTLALTDALLNAARQHGWTVCTARAFLERTAATPAATETVAAAGVSSARG